MKKSNLNLKEYGVTELSCSECQSISGGFLAYWAGKAVAWVKNVFERPPQPAPDHIYRQTMGGVLWNTGMIGII